MSSLRSSSKWSRAERFLLFCPLLLLVVVGGGMWLRRLMTLNLQSVAYLPNGDILCAYRDTRVIVRDGRTGRDLRTLGVPRSANALAFAMSPDGKTVLVQGKTGNEVMVLDTKTGAVRHTLAISPGMWAKDTLFSSDGQLAIVQSGSATRVFGASNGKLRTALDDTSGQSAFAFRDKNTAICATNWFNSGSGAVLLGVRDISTGNWRRVWKRGGAVIGDLVLSHDGRMVATSSYEPFGPTISGDPLGVTLYDARTGKEAHALQPSGWFSRLAFSPDGSRLAACLVKSADVYVWEVATGRQLFTVHHQSTLNLGKSVSLAWSPDGNTLLTGSTNDELCLWDGHTGQEKQFTA